MSSWNQRLGELLARLRERRPLIHHLTNDVVTNLTANVTLALGAAPVMAPCRDEVEEMVGHAGALVLNIGTLDAPLVEAMLLAGRRARQRGVPVVLDPVGAGATALRTTAARRLLDELRPALVRGNPGELRVLAVGSGQVRGVDSLEKGTGWDADLVAWAGAAGLVAAATGVVDHVSDGQRRVEVHNGHALLARVTGTGCSVTTACACFLAVAPEAPLDAAVAGLAAFGLAAERAAERAAGPGTFVPHLLDALDALDPEALERGARVVERP